MPSAEAFRGQMPPGMFGSFKLPKPLVTARAADGPVLPVTSPGGVSADGEPVRTTERREVGGPRTGDLRIIIRALQ